MGLYFIKYFENILNQANYNNYHAIGTFSSNMVIIFIAKSYTHGNTLLGHIPRVVFTYDYTYK